MSSLQIKADRFIENFVPTVKKSRAFFFRHAWEGWLYLSEEEAKFIDPNLKKLRPATTPPPPESPDLQKSSNNAAECLEQLQATKDHVELWSSLKKLLLTHNDLLCADDFCDLSGAALDTALREAVNAGSRNIVVLGAGIMGLAFVSMIKAKLGNAVNVIMIDKRAAAPHIKKPYSRDWLTEIPSAFVQCLDPQVLKILSRLNADDEFYGAPINMFETVLMLSCRKFGVKFLFLEDYNLNFLKGSNVAFIVDATGGQFDPDCVVANDRPVQFNFRGVTKMELKREGAKFYPYTSGKRIKTALIKVTNVPVSQTKRILEYTKYNKRRGQVYFWRGRLKSEINSSMVFVNLDQKSYEILAQSMIGSVPFEKFLTMDCFAALSPKGGARTFFEFLRRNGKGLDKMRVEPPFIYAPHLHDFRQEFAELHGHTVIPLGDSVFNGSPKIGNGLQKHLHFLYAVYQEFLC